MGAIAVWFYLLEIHLTLFSRRSRSLLHSRPSQANSDDKGFLQATLRYFKDEWKAKGKPGEFKEKEVSCLAF